MMPYAHIDPATCSVADVLHFLRYRLKVYVAAIASFCSPLGGQLIDRHALVVNFLKGAKRLHSPCPPAVPPWALGVLLRAFSQLSLEHLASVDMKELSLKSALRLALASAKRIRDLHVFSVDSNCICLGPGGCSLTLRPRPGCVPNYYLPSSECRLFRCLPCYLHLSAASPPSSVAIGGNGVCALSSLVCIVQGRLLVASLTAGLNIVLITENFSVMSRESSRGNAPVTILTSVPWDRERDITEVAVLTAPPAKWRSVSDLDIIVA